MSIWTSLFWWTEVITFHQEAAHWGDHKKKLMNLGTKSELVGELENGAEEMEGRAKAVLH